MSNFELLVNNLSETESSVSSAENMDKIATPSAAAVDYLISIASD